ncbi:MAG TPA: histidine kinase, partial [Aggregicoccus sp.]|nr:histidine kinase [Aggregicoccus sp.]
MRTSRPLPGFWHLQLAGWTLYGAALIITFLPMISAEGGVLRLVEVKSVRAALGLVLSSLLRLGYRRLAPGTALARQAAWA